MFEKIACLYSKFSSVFYFSVFTDTVNDLSGYSNSSFHVGAYILNLLVLYFSMYSKC